MLTQKAKNTYTNLVISTFRSLSASKLFKSSILVVLLVGVAKAVSLAKEVLVADQIGVSSALDAFIIALSLIHI